MHVIGFVAGLGLILLALLDGFEAILMPRRVTHRLRFSRVFYRGTWQAWRSIGRLLRPGKRREAFLSVFGPASLLALFAIWASALITGFGLLHWSLRTSPSLREKPAALPHYIYMSGETFFTLGYGDVTPSTSFGRFLAVVQAGTGFGFIAVIVSYLPVLYQASSRREVEISLLDARAGSPPTAAQALLRAARGGQCAALDPFLAQWERWSAELLESHLSFPVLSYYRSQHDNQSWLAALTTILDTCALLIVAMKHNAAYQAQLTFAMARHAAVDLALVLKVPPRTPPTDRLGNTSFGQLMAALRKAGFELNEAQATREHLAEMRATYEPFVEGLARHFLMTLPAFTAEEPVVDNWQRSAWQKHPPGVGQLPRPSGTDEHFT